MSELVDSTADPNGAADHQMFGICDRQALTDADLRAPVPGTEWLGVGRSAVLVGVVMDFLGLDVRLEHWTAEPPAAQDPEVTTTIELHFPTGSLTYDAVAAGPRPDFFAVPPGTYKVRVSGWGRAGIRERWLETHDLDGDEAEQATEDLRGQERYLFQLWPSPPSER
ncbi:hypothetical protein [Actinomadura rupiterrae]|uniref:hypothetical protein n=1 Tax=Actinomadura rupiterrae TaxID=559627 RepID=UPI0020A60CA7|nr:hypothetical protein [Actinomadura rupiterrae]MCP2339267.1 hypothetical protein [Actinomadura rupiterrae]